MDGHEESLSRLKAVPLIKDFAVQAILAEHKETSEASSREKTIVAVAHLILKAIFSSLNMEPPLGNWKKDTRRKIV